MNLGRVVSTLGLKWATSEDYFFFKTSIMTFKTRRVTKRLFLSVISRLLDPLGWLAPFLIRDKLIMQDLWI